MKQFICALLIACILCLSCGCTSEQSSLETPVRFYYCASNISYHSEDAVISSEMRESVNLQGDLQNIMNLYLQGPVSSELYSPIPEGVTVSGYSFEDVTMQITLSENFSELTGLDLTLACACIANTLFDLTDCEVVQISAAEIFLDGKQYIEINRQSILTDPVSATAA